ncbi:hybrid sensor histidine kinase/response regulator [Caulobacter segnis]|uniref:Sensory/regulatory protein RpfC n=2 Tax=Caulobacter segnis TaxID=88688 RepID=D5VMS0_CAUST|nr:ATP-binding protein [Caulobacter segnis]ADG11793.1 integral membrane sensor hybrid histidine kinase [Caulobacter segnis ATCC 21756]AVQ03431.1 hybrid sensor histidine kinase/response regulator [Caulobacter segnis]
MQVKDTGSDRRAEVALTRAYVPIVRGYLIASSVYYALISLSHPFYEKGFALLLLESLAVAACLYGFGAWRALREGRIVGPGLEGVALGMNALFLSNVLAYQILHFEPMKLVYFVLMGLVFATSAPSRRVALGSVSAAVIGLVWMAQKAPGDTINNYAFIGLAGAFAAIGMSTLMRGVVRREVRARLASEALNVELQRELTENRRLKTEAQALALTAETANRAKTEFLATMSHEIRTPLNGVLGMAQIMAAGELSPDQRRRLDTVTASGQSLLSVINAILDISKIEAGKMEINPAPFDLSAHLDALRQLYGGLARDKELDFSLEIAEGAQGWRMGDADRLRQVMSNLISNAIKFTDVGTVRVFVEGDDKTIVARVTDSGAGIPEAERGRLFTKFAQLDSSSTRRAGGSGLGLAICKTLSELMGGSISYSTAEGGGACFTVTLPMPRVKPADGLDSPAIAGPDTAADAPRILVVDDNQTNRAVLLTLLSHLGVAAHFAVDGRDALAMWERARWDAILMDIHMPIMDGVQASQTIRAREKATGRPRTPIIAVTASVLTHERTLYAEAGMDGIVAKPVEIPRLVEALGKALSIDPVVDHADTRGVA